MLCKWYLFSGVQMWKIKKSLYFFLKFMNTNVWRPQKCNYIENLTILKFWWFFLFVERSGFVIKLIAAKVTHQRLFFITYSYFLYDNIWNLKKWIVIVHEYHDKWPNVTLVQHFCRGCDHANLVSSLRSSKYLPTFI